jgi:hypothetical protein
MPHTLPGNRTLGALYCELADPRTVERRVYLSCPAHDVNLFCSLGSLSPPGSPQRRTSNSLMRLQGQTSKLKRSGRLPSRNLPWQTPQNLSERFGRRFSLGNARPMEIVATPVKLRALSCEDSFVSGEPSRPHSGGSLQPPDRQFRYYKLPRNSASSPTASYRSTNVILGIRPRPGQKVVGSAKRTKRHFFKWRFVSLRWSLASQQIAGDGYLHRAFYRLPQPVCRFFGGCFLLGVCCFAGWPDILQQPVHHWHPLNSNRYAVLRIL